MFIPSQNDLTKRLSKRSALITGVLGLLISISVAVLATLSGDKIAIGFAVIFCTLLAFFSLSLLLGKGSKGNGIFSPFTLYILGAIFIVIDVILSIFNKQILIAGVMLGLGCFALAKKRRTRT
ncbi:hypothetical protein [Alteromonas flava]|uniref:hypothetical protein n=1 Tax=Alteromonas flava TaxID=2048003 RepID=UPI000C28CE2B|nr:hypothetical protein [Alteromonas flava]